MFQQRYALRAAAVLEHHLVVHPRALGLGERGVEPRSICLAARQQDGLEGGVGAIGGRRWARARRGGAAQAPGGNAAAAAAAGGGVVGPERASHLLWRWSLWRGVAEATVDVAVAVAKPVVI